MKQNKKAIIFDLFGTLTKGRCDPELEIIKKYNLSLEYKFVEKFVSGTKFKNEKSYIEKIIKELSFKNTAANRKNILKIIKKEINKAVIHPKCEKVLSILKKKGYKLGLLSGAPTPDYDLITKNGLEKYFTSKIFSYEVGLTKPDPRLFKLSLKELSVKPKMALMVGDSLEDDIREAKRLGINGILISKFKKNFSPAYTVVSRLENVVGVIDIYFTDVIKA